MNCQRATALLSPLADGELTADSAAELARHLAGCPACQAQMAAIRRLDGQLRALPRPETAPLSAAAVLAGRVGQRPPGRLQRFWATIFPPPPARAALLAELGDLPPQLMAGAYLRLIGQA